MLGAQHNVAAMNAKGDLDRDVTGGYAPGSDGRGNLPRGGAAQLSLAVRHMANAAADGAGKQRAGHSITKACAK
jgi:hypothetical protein